MAPDNVQHTIIFDPRGDLRLEVWSNFEDEDPTQPDSFHSAFIVCSRTLARASPVFATRLYGDNSEARPADGQWVVRLPDDCAKVFAILLSIIHRPFDKPPNKNNGDDSNDQASQGPGDAMVQFAQNSGRAIYRNSMVHSMAHFVTKLAQKYGLTYVVIPWVNHWLSDAEDKADAEDEVSRVDSPHRLCTGWILGDESVIAHQLRHLARSSRLNEQGEFHIVDYVGAGFEGNNQESDSASDIGLILDALEVRVTIADRRLKLIKAMIGPLETFIADGLYEDSQSSWRCRWEPADKSPFCKFRRNKERRSCDGAVLAGHVQALTELGIFPLKRAHRLSAIDLYNKLVRGSLVEDSIEAIRKSDEFGDTHTNCDISPVVMGWRKTVEDAFNQDLADESFPDFTPSQKARIAQQRVQARQSPASNGL